MAELPGLPGTESGIIKQQNNKPVASRKRKVKESEPVQVNIPTEQMQGTGDKFIQTIQDVEVTRRNRAVDVMVHERNLTLKTLADVSDTLTDQLIDALGDFIDYE